MIQKLETIVKQMHENEHEFRDELYVIKRIYLFNISGKKKIAYDDILYDGQNQNKMLMSPAKLITSLMRLEKKGLIKTEDIPYEKGSPCTMTGYKLSRGLIGIMRSYL